MKFLKTSFVIAVLVIMGSVFRVSASEDLIQVEVTVVTTGGYVITDWNNQHSWDYIAVYAYNEDTEVYYSPGQDDNFYLPEGNYTFDGDGYVGGIYRQQKYIKNEPGYDEITLTAWYE